MKEKIFVGLVQDGKIDLGSDYNRSRMKMALREFEGQRIAFEIRPTKRLRSLKQNAYYWGAIIPTFLQIFNTGLTETEEKWKPEDVHEKLKLEFNYRLLKTADGYEKIPCSTADLTIGKFVEYTMRIEQYCSENGIYLPQVAEYDFAPLKAAITKETTKK